ncbi:hypothetical protein CCP2SC5_450014 [Azospirillaceae bacterium]
MFEGSCHIFNLDHRYSRHPFPFGCLGPGLKTQNDIFFTPKGVKNASLSP